MRFRKLQAAGPCRTFSSRLKEILRDVFVPVSLVHSQRISKALVSCCLHVMFGSQEP